MIYNEKSLPVIPYTVKQLASIYKVKPKVLNSWLRKFKDELGEKQGHYYLIPQVKLIFSKLDLPGEFENVEEKIQNPSPPNKKG